MELDPNDPKYALAAADILGRHNHDENETNITSAIRDFLITTELAQPSQIVEENPPSESSRRAVDLTALDTFIEVKRRIGTTAPGQPNPDYVAQIDDYLLQSQQSGKGVRMGVLTDGKYWLLRWPGAGEVKTAPPYLFTLKKADNWLLLFEWLRDRALTPIDNLAPDREAIAQHFGPGSPQYQRDIDGLRALYRQNADAETIKVKRELWHGLLRTALGELAQSQESLDDLFVRHTYLSAVIGMVVQASFGIDLRAQAESDAGDLIRGRELNQRTGLQGVVESDFFSWPAEVGGLPMLKALAHRAARFNWAETPTNVAVMLYEIGTPMEERRQLGEYYTPDWLARTMVRELITDPLNSRMLDPACGSGAFLTEAVAHFIDAAQNARWEPLEILNRLRTAVVGIDVHPAAVHLARSAWALAARPAIEAATNAGFDSPLPIPVYLGDSLQLLFSNGDLFSEHMVTIDVGDEQHTRLVFPVSLVDRAEDFDALMSDITYSIENGLNPLLAMDDNHITDPDERRTLETTIEEMRRLHAQGRDHIWAYYTRNLVRPVAFSRAKVDVLIGNPPWINYNQTAEVLREKLRELSENRYGIWVGGRYASNQDVAGLFFARCIELYLRQGGLIGFVMPHSALQSGQYAKWRTGQWQSPARGRGKNRASEFTLSADFTHKAAWDLERLEPNTFFPIPSCVVFARNTGQSGLAEPLTENVENWRGPAGAETPRRTLSNITNAPIGSESPYARYSHQGASIRPRRLFFVEETENPAIIQAGQTITVNPRLGSHDKEPWRSLNLNAITRQTIESAHIFNVLLGEALVPYATLTPLKAALPVKQSEAEIPADSDDVGGIRMGGLERRMRLRWQTISGMWESHKSAVNRMNLLENLDHYGKLSSQLEWMRNHDVRPIRVLYTAAGRPTAAVLSDDAVLVDETLYWIACKDLDEAHYLLAIINSNALASAVNQFTTPNWAGDTRVLHKHLWKLPIPEYDPANRQHIELSNAGQAAAQGAAQQLAQLRQERGGRLTVTIARRELRKWLRESPEGAAVEAGVARLLAGA